MEVLCDCFDVLLVALVVIVLLLSLRLSCLRAGACARGFLCVEEESVLSGVELLDAGADGLGVGGVALLPAARTDPAGVVEDHPW